MVMKYLSLAAFAILLTTATCRASEQSNLFRDVYACPERGSSSVCVYGTIPKGKQVTVIAKGWKSSALPKEKFSNANEDIQNGIRTSTRLRVAASPPKDATMIAILADTSMVNELPFEEVQDGALVGRIGRHIQNTKELNLDPDIRLLKTRLLRLSPTILLSETFLSPPNDVPDLEKQLSSGCSYCENVPILVGQKLMDLFKDVRSTKVNVEHTCGGIEFAFALSGRTYVLSHAFSCESDSFSATLIHDVSQDKPKLVFRLAGGF
ncbi:hypothetical protein [Bradyrhizobium sp. AZCC 1693]|uniref:hypothetical protein n=1 Tax=Bradyrhizobium sp. AZCC 1693 TaxID=3117029 RepID=UPI002FEEBEC9